MSEPEWRLVVMPPARRESDRLPVGVAAAVLETLGAIQRRRDVVGADGSPIVGTTGNSG